MTAPAAKPAPAPEAHSAAAPEAPAPAVEAAQEAPASPEAVAAAEEPSKAQRAKEAADKARKGAAANRKLMEERQRLEQAAQYQAQRTAELESRVQQADQLIRSMAQDPVGTLKQLGVTPEQMAQRMAMEGSPEAKIQALEAMIAQERAERQKLVDQQRQREESVRRQQLENDYKQEAQNPKKYPNLATIHPDFILSRTKELIGELQARGHDPRQFSNHDLLSYLDSTYTKAESTPAAPASAPADKKTSTVTNRLQTATHAAPPDFSKMTDRQQKRWMAEQLRPLIK